MNTTPSISPSISAFMRQPAEDYLDESTNLGPIEAALAHGDPLSKIAVGRTLLGVGQAAYGSAT